MLLAILYIVSEVLKTLHSSILSCSGRRQSQMEESLWSLWQVSAVEQLGRRTRTGEKNRVRMHWLGGFEILVRLDLPVKLPVTCGWIWGTKGRQRVEAGWNCSCIKNRHWRRLFFWSLLQKLEIPGSCCRSWKVIQSGLADHGHSVIPSPDGEFPSTLSRDTCGLVWLKKNPGETRCSIALFSTPSSPSQTFSQFRNDALKVEGGQQIKPPWKMKWIHLKCIKEPAPLHYYFPQTIS